MTNARSVGDIVSRYLNGYYPYLDRETNGFYWDQQTSRAILPINQASGLKARKILEKSKPVFTIMENSHFEEVVTKLSEDATRSKSSPSWVRGEVKEIYSVLNEYGLINTIEAHHEGRLVGGLLGIRLPGVFIAETMFGTMADASKACVMFMYCKYKDLGFDFIDVQVEHDRSSPVGRLGEKVISIDDYTAKLRRVVKRFSGDDFRRASSYDDLFRACSECLSKYGQKSQQWKHACELIEKRTHDENGILAWWKLIQGGYSERFRSVLNLGLFDSRKQMTFPSSRDEWREAAAISVIKDEGQSLEIFGFQVMQSWEKPLMDAMADAVTYKDANILEVGYGLGICSRRIQESSPRVHVIIEANEEVAATARHDFEGLIALGKVHVINAFWQDLVDGEEWFRNLGLESFDGIVFDTFPLSSEELRRNHFAFLPTAFKLLRSRGRVTYFSDETESLSEFHQHELVGLPNHPQVSMQAIEVTPWPSCEYWHDNQILLVVLSKP
jgi:guanidinoacetate N-methyltransferase